MYFLDVRELLVLNTMDELLCVYFFIWLPVAEPLPRDDLIRGSTIIHPCLQRSMRLGLCLAVTLTQTRAGSQHDTIYFWPPINQATS